MIFLLSRKTSKLNIEKTFEQTSKSLMNKLHKVFDESISKSKFTLLKQYSYRR